MLHTDNLTYWKYKDSFKCYLLSLLSNTVKLGLFIYKTKKKKTSYKWEPLRPTCVHIYYLSYKYTSNQHKNLERKKKHSVSGLKAVETQGDLMQAQDYIPKQTSSGHEWDLNVKEGPILNSPFTLLWKNWQPAPSFRHAVGLICYVRSNPWQKSNK